ncbi:hypothetical protein FEM48_ZijujUnG0115200 [Ziziphus jujuba var. spinosa]|uniref:Uncharacterized protein n=1 Tax=Ziziphus jujuba var. spinosa TaxID=714518 RepID=A0A978U7Y4_ZIZJJ|nr:hypothetical protein FEM48_ZijujUnG0115200 [Ziziphus jujuba var. spinosa]
MVVKRLSDSYATNYNKVLYVSIGFYEEDVLEVVMKGQVVEYKQSRAFFLHMRKKRVMAPLEEVDLSSIKYEDEEFQGNFQIYSYIADLLNWNKFDELLNNTEIPEAPTFKPEFPPQVFLHCAHFSFDVPFCYNQCNRSSIKMIASVWHELEPKPGVVMLNEEGKPKERVELASKSLQQYDPASYWNGDSTPLISFQTK